VLAIGHGHYVFYAHLKRGSVTVKPGQRVHRGEVLGELGNTGNTSAPHLHIQVMNGPSPLASDGLPYVIDRFELAGQVAAGPFNAAPGVVGVFPARRLVPAVARRDQFPLNLNIVGFP
jgi:murein DD-endopeptidase MepM/ murein hydrolase activator NlpD